MSSFMQSEVPVIMAKSSEAHIRANAKYYDANMSRVSVALNRKTQGDVVDRFDSVSSKLGYVVTLVRNDIYRVAQASLTIDGTRIESCDVARYAELIHDNFDAFKSQCDPGLFDRVSGLFREDTPAYIIVGEYLRTASDDIVVGSSINIDEF